MWHLVAPHVGLGLGLGIVDSSLMPLLAQLMDENQGGGAYGSVYAVSQSAVSLAYGFGPLLGGYLAETFGFPAVMRAVGAFNIIYAPILLWLRCPKPEPVRMCVKKSFRIKYCVPQ